MEKSRITSQSANERNYHVFYQLCAGVDDSEKAKWSLKAASQFNYLKKSTSIDGVDDAEEFDNLKVSSLLLFNYYLFIILVFE